MSDSGSLVVTVMTAVFGSEMVTLSLLVKLGASLTAETDTSKSAEVVVFAAASVTAKLIVRSLVVGVSEELLYSTACRPLRSCDRVRLPEVGVRAKVQVLEV